MEPLLYSQPLKVRVYKNCFDLKANQEISIIPAQPMKGHLVAIRRRGKTYVAKYHGPYVELANGSITWLYSLVGVIVQ